MLLQLQNVPAAMELKQVMSLCQVLLCDDGSDIFFLILQLCSLKMGCNSLEEAIGITDW